MKQGFEFLDTESGFKFKLTGTSDVLPKDITVVIPDDVDGAVLATSKEVEDLRTKLTNGTITVRNTDTVGNKQASDFALVDLSNVDLSGLNIGTGGNSEGYFNIGSYENNVTGAVPAVNNFIPFLSLESDLNTIDASQKIDNSTFLLKAGRTYKIEGGLISFTATSGTATTFFKLYNANTSEEIVLDKNTPLYSQTSAGTGLIRNFVPNFYYTPTVDVHLKLKVFSSTLVSCTNYQTLVIITEYMSKDLALKSVTINGKTFDENNNIDLEGISTLASYSTEETLTEKRWIDGKPIYRIVLGDYTWAADDIIVPFDRDQETIVYKTYLINNIEEASSSHYVSDTSEGRLGYISSSKTFVIQYYDGAAWAVGYKFKIILEYTKVSDTAESPVRLVGSGNGSSALVSELPAMVGNEGRLLKVNQNGQLEWFDNSFVGASYQGAATSLVANTSQVINLGTKKYDTHNAVVGNVFTAPVSGYYQIIGKVSVNTATYVRAQVLINGGNRIGTDASSGIRSIYSDIVYLNIGDTVSLSVFQSATNTISNSDTWLTIALMK